MAQIVKNLPAMQETGVRSLGQKNPLEKEMATHSSILAWRIAWTEEPGGLRSMELQESDCATLTLHFKLMYPLEWGRATHSSILAWRIAWTEKPSRLHSIGSQRVVHN